MQLGAGFDVIKREEAVKKFYQVAAIKEEADCSARRLEKLRKVP